MNLNFTSFSFVEKVFVYGGIFLSSVFIVTLSSILNKERIIKKIGNIFYLIAMIFLFLSNVFLFLYLKMPVEFVAGIEIQQISLFLFIVFFIYIMFSYNEIKTGSDYILLLINIICLQFLFYHSSFILISLLFIVFEVTSSFLTEKINTKKYFYILLSLFFLGIYLIGEKSKIQTIGINGVLAFLLFSTFASTWTFNIHDISHSEDRKNYNLLLMVLLASFVVFFKLIKFCNSYSPIIYVLFLMSFILLLFSIFNFLTEEDLLNFFISDFINVFYLTIFSFSVLTLNNMDIIVVFILMLAAAVFLMPFLTNIQKRYSISYARYNFNKIKGAGVLLLGIISTLLVEMYLIYKIVNNFRYFNSYIQTIILIIGFVYGVVILDKIFIVFSMISRIKFGNLKYILFNKIIIRPVLFILLIISLVCWGIKNG